MATAGDIAINLVANPKNFQKGLSQSQKSLMRFKRIALSAASSIGAALALRGSISLAQTQIQAEKKLEAVLKATGNAAGLTAGQIKAYASELQGLTNFGDEVTISAAAVLATFKSLSGDTFKKTLRLSQDLAAVMGTDLQSAVVQLGKALNDPKVGLTALTRSGVTFTESQKELIKTLVSSNRLLEAQEVILKEVESQFGGAAAAMADPITQFQNTVGDLGEKIGNALIPRLNESADLFRELMENSDGLVQAINLLADAFDVLATASSKLGSAAGEMKKYSTALGEFFGVIASGGSVDDMLSRGEVDAAAGDQRGLTLREKQQRAIKAEEARKKAAEARQAQQDQAAGVLGNLAKTPDQLAALVGGGVENFIRGRQANPIGGSGFSGGIATVPGLSPLSPFNNDINGGVRSIPGIEMPEPPEPRLAGATSTQSADAFSMIARAGLGRSGKAPELKVQEKTEKNTNRIADLLDKFLTSDTTLAVVESF